MICKAGCDKFIPECLCPPDCPTCYPSIGDGGTRAKIQYECDYVKAMLLQKNAAYGDSAMNPVRVFSRADVVEQLKVRIDDKLSRLARGSPDEEDVTLDLIGYLILLRIAEGR